MVAEVIDELSRYVPRRQIAITKSRSQLEPWMFYLPEEAIRKLLTRTEIGISVFGNNFIIVKQELVLIDNRELGLEQFRSELPGLLLKYIVNGF